jgi:hypothetical protein
MRLFAVLCFTVLLGSATQAQLLSVEDMIQGAISVCVSQRGAAAQPYCNCWVRRWVGLWDEYDSLVWRRTAMPTARMRQMEDVAASQCGG